MKKNLFKLIAFFIIFCALFFCFQKVFKFKDVDGIFSMEAFYREPDESIDVMFFGSSHIFENINTGILWDEYGYASFELCGSVQPFWNSYYYMKEALKTQKPKLMVLDVFRAVETDDYDEPSRIIKNNFGLKLSLDKISSVLTSSPQESVAQYLLEYPTYHSRYQDITREDFGDHVGTASYKYWKGFTMNPSQNSFEKPVDFMTDERRALSEKTETYLIKMIGLCKENDIPLLLIKTPYIITKSDQMIYNTVSDIASRENIPFINFNFYYDEMGLDFENDIADNDHLNPYGNAKFTRFLADYIKSHYDIPVRTHETKYASYDLMSQMCDKEVYNWEISTVLDLPAYINYISAGDYLSIYSLSEEVYDAANYEDVANILKQAANIDINSFSKESIWVARSGKLLASSEANMDAESAQFAEEDAESPQFVKENAGNAQSATEGAGNAQFTQGAEIDSSDTDEAYLWHTDLGEDNIIWAAVDKDEGARINYNGTFYRAVSKGLNIFSYDPLTESFVESAGFALEESGINYTKIKEDV